MNISHDLAFELDEENLDLATDAAADARLDDLRRNWFWTTRQPRPLRNLAGTGESAPTPDSSDWDALDAWLAVRDPFAPLFRRKMSISFIPTLRDETQRAALRRLAHRYRAFVRVRAAERAVLGEEEIF